MNVVESSSAPMDKPLELGCPKEESLIQRVRNAAVFAAFVGDSPKLLQAVELLSAFAPSSETVLIEGETGTGKELAARALHYASDRAQFAFIPINCAAIPETLLEDELFGHERGAFTDARMSRRGIVAEAEGGTLFLDEIDTLSSRAQAALLRVLQERRYRPVGASGEKSVNVRFVVATNISLENHASRGLFRSDLLYRLAVFQVRLPSLRERRTDIPKLADHFLQKHAAGRSIRFTANAQAVMMRLEWPGNVRQLENAVIRACHVCIGDSVDVSDLGLLPSSDQATSAPAVSSSVPGSIEPMRDAKQRVVRNFEREYLASVMSVCNGNVSRAARVAGKDRREMGKLLKKHSINPLQFSNAPHLFPPDR